MRATEQLLDELAETPGGCATPFCGGPTQHVRSIDGEFYIDHSCPCGCENHLIGPLDETLIEGLLHRMQRSVWVLRNHYRCTWEGDALEDSP